MKKTTLMLILALVMTFLMATTVCAYTNPGAVESPDDMVITPLIYMYEDSEYEYFTTVLDMRKFYKNDFAAMNNWEINCVAEPKSNAVRQKTIQIMRNVDPGFWIEDDFWGTLTRISYNAADQTITVTDVGYFTKSGHLFFKTNWAPSEYKVHKIAENAYAQDVAKEINLFLQKEKANPRDLDKIQNLQR